MINVKVRKHYFFGMVLIFSIVFLLTTPVFSQIDNPPVAYAGIDQIVSWGDMVTLDGSWSYDLEGPITFLWEEISTAPLPIYRPMLFGDRTTPTVEFRVPAFESRGRVESIRFKLIVTDSTGKTDTDEVEIIIVENKNTAIFVSENLGDDSNDGTSNSPVQSINKAIELANQDLPRSDIYIDQGDYNSGTTLGTYDDMSIYGGFLASLMSKSIYNPIDGFSYSAIFIRWNRPTMTTERIETNPTTIFSASTAFKISEISRLTIIEGLIIQPADGLDNSDGPGENSIGIYVRNANESLIIRKNRITAGQGGNGGNGIDGRNGRDGANGGDGQDGGDYISRGGSSGQNNWGGNDGGKGGDGPEKDSEYSKGIDGQGYNGGKGGDFQSSRVKWPYPLGYVTVTGDGNFGNPGGNGNPGKNGIGGDGYGTVISGKWYGSSGETGDDGNIGGGGGGGASGRGNQQLVFYLNLFGFKIKQYNQKSGGGGGGGGSGAEGGKGGEGGFGGGGSFGIFLVNASPIIAGNRISTIGGGKGGDGGLGGEKGVGGERGKGGAGIKYTYDDDLLSQYRTTWTYYDVDGGEGGDGGDGGLGGNGGGGGGGASIGIYLHENSLPLIYSNSFSEVKPPYYTGKPATSLIGPSGAGGLPNGEPGIRGDIGPNPLQFQDVQEPIGNVIVPPGDEVGSMVNVFGESGLGSIEFTSTWGDVVDPTIAMSLVSPSGKLITRNSTDPNVFNQNGYTFETFKITNPETGNWTIKLFGIDVPPEGEEVVITYTRLPKNSSFEGWILVGVVAVIVISAIGFYVWTRKTVK